MDLKRESRAGFGENWRGDICGELHFNSGKVRTPAGPSVGAFRRILEKLETNTYASLAETFLAVCVQGYARCEPKL